MTTDPALLQRLSEIYRRGLAESQEARAFLAGRGIADAALLERFGVGYAAGDLAEILPADRGIRERLRQLGVTRRAGPGKETLAGCVVVPITDPTSCVVGLVGYPLAAGERRIAGAVEGMLFNWQAIGRTPEIAVVEDPLEALGRVAGGQEAVAIPGRPTEETGRMLAQLRPGKLTVDGPPKWAAAVRKIAPSDGPPVERLDDGFALEISGRRYIVQGVTRENPRRLRALVRTVAPGGRVHIGALDLYSARERAAYAREVALLVGQEPRALEGDLMQIVALAEREAKSEQTAVPAMTPSEREQAMELLTCPDLPARIVEDFGRVGLVGETAAKLVGYLVAVSRKLRDPLSMLTHSRSAAGKSTLAEAVARLTPPEDVIQLTRLTGQALFYQKGASLRHKLLVVEEESGVGEAAYPLRILQSARRLAVATATGSHEVEGPVAIIVTTTRVGLDDETKSRFLVVSVDESDEQTARIHEAQRRAETVEGIQARAKAQEVIRLHHNAQRLLRPLRVVNAFAPKLRFPVRRLATRRAHAQYLALIRAVALLRQFHKTLKSCDEGQYIEVDRTDIKIAHGLVGELLGRGLDDLSPPARRLLGQIQAWRPKEPFTRRQAAEALGWASMPLWRHLTELTEHERVLRRRDGGRWEYRLEPAVPEVSEEFSGFQEDFNE